MANLANGCGETVSAVPSSQQVRAVQTAVGQVLDRYAHGLVGAYYNPSAQTYSGTRNVLFAGRYFDELPDNKPGSFTAGDLAAASLLDVRFGPHVVLELLERDECNDLLAKIPTELAIWDAPADELGRDSAAWRLWRQLVSIPGVSTTRASKLLARKRPHLMPILDSVIVDRLALREVDAWQALRAAVTPELRDRIDGLAGAATGHGARRPSTLRLLDVATWMRFSRSGHARAVRRMLGME
jgi:hypothetical protein